jgi:hypothetical protein
VGIGAVRTYYRAPEGEGLSEMSDPEPDAIFRKRLICLACDELRPFVRIATGSELDAIGRIYGRFRTGVPLKGFEGFRKERL